MSRTSNYRQIHLDTTLLTYIDQGCGPPIVFIHGSGPTDLRTWEHQIEPFAAHFRVIAYSRRSHYPNPPTGDHASAHATRIHARDLADMITRLQLGRVHLVGFSFGADIALRLAVDHPELARTLTLTGPPLLSWLATLPGGPELLEERINAIRPAKRAIQQGNLERGAQLFIDGLMGKGTFDTLPRSSRARIMDNAHLIGAEPVEIGDIGTDDITRDEAATIQVPVLLINGTASPSAFLRVSQELIRRLPNAAYVQIGGASHLIHVTHPQAYNAAVMEFLAKHRD